MIKIPIADRFMLIDNEHEELFLGMTLRLQKSRNTTYAAFGKNGRAHRLILGLSDKNMVVDHINGDGLDNRISNLRAVSSAVNVKNRRRSRSKRNGMPPGMWPYRGKIAVQITNNGKKIFVGYFTEQAEAHNALNKARVEIGRPII